MDPQERSQEQPQEHQPDRPRVTPTEETIVSEPTTDPQVPAGPIQDTGWWKAEWPPPEAAGSNRPPRRGRAALAAVIAGVVLLAGGIGIGWGLGRTGGGTSSTGAETPLRMVPQIPSSNGGGGTGSSAQAIARRVDPAVVDINTVINGFTGQPRAQGAGTGMVLTSSGEVLTNNHVIAGATSITVTIVGRSGSYKASVLGADPTDDVALLQIQGVSGLSTVTLADSSTLTLGQRVIAIGNALGRGGTPTVTEGTVSALGRSITVGDENGKAEQLANVIQTDAPISPGDSGGPLVNEAGQVIGIITASSRSRQAEPVSTMSFAIPVNDAIGVVNQIRAGESSSRILIGATGFLGVETQNLDAATASRLGLSLTSGALVAGVIPGTPASKAGIPANAVITAIDGRRITSADQLGPAIYVHKPGERIQVTWVDGSGTHRVTVSLIAGPAV